MARQYATTGSAGSRIARVALWWLMCAFACIARAAPNYVLDIDAPEAFITPLKSQTMVGRWREEPGFDEGEFDLFTARARDEVRAIAEAAGYYSASVEVVHTVRPSGEHVIRISLVPGKPTVVSNLELSVRGGAQGTAVATLVRREWALKHGATFRFGEWELAKRRALEQLQAAGYLRAKIGASRADVDPESASVSLTIEFDAGARVAFGDVVIHGLKRYPESIVRDLCGWRAGDPYVFERLLELRQRLVTTAYFTSVSVTPDLTALERDPTLEAVPVRVEVNEQLEQSVAVGAGYSTDRGFRGLAGYDHRNLLDRGWTLESGALVETVRRRVFGTVSSPWDTSGARWQGGARFERQDVEGELVQRATAFVGRGRKEGDIESFTSLQYQFEYQTVATGTGVPIRDPRAALTAGYAWNLRRLDSRVDPRDGYTISAQASAAAKGVMSDRSFARLYARSMGFLPMPRETPIEGGALIGLVEAGWVLARSASDIPSENLFRTGGAQAVRGYPYQSLGVPNGTAVVGGRVLALASLEYQHPVVPTWLVAAFYDYGNAADAWSAWRPVAGYGGGVRWRSPVGPVNLDVAYGQAVHAWRVHFSVGYSF